MPRGHCLSMPLIAAAMLVCHPSSGAASGPGSPENVVELGRWTGRAGASGLAPLPTAAPEERLVLVGVSDGIAVVNTFDAGAMTEIGFVPGVTSSSRAIARYLTLAYVVSPDGGGLQVLNVADPASPTEISSDLATFDRATDVLVDAAGQRLFVTAQPGRLLVFDLDTPLAPVLTGAFDGELAPTGMAFANELVYVGTGGALATLDVSGVPVISLAAYVTYPGSATRAVTVDPGRGLAFATDDRPGGTLSTFDVASLGASVRLATTTDPASTAVTGIAGDDLTVYSAGAGSGLVATDVSDPRVPEPFARFPSPDGRDVLPAGDGTVLMTDRVEGLLALSVAPALGTLTGALTVSGTGEAATSVTVRVRGTGKTYRTGGDGTFRLRVTPGAYRVVFDRLRFEPDSVDVSVAAGESVVVDRELVDRPTGTLRGNITRLTGPGAPVSRPLHPEGTFVAFLDAPVDAVQAFDGFYFRPFLPAGTYLIEAREFGFNSVQATVTVTTGATTFQNFTLERAPIVDTFETDAGWIVDPDDTATSGRWERGVPVGTAAGYVAPNRDETPAPGVNAFVTGLGAGGDWIDAHDVDGGTTSLISPTYDLAGVDQPILQFYHWFSNDAHTEVESGDGDPFTVAVSTDGGDTWTGVYEIRDSRLFWRGVTIVLSRHVVPSSETRIRFRVSDEGAPSIVEAAVDDVAIWDGRHLVALPDDTPVRLDVTAVEAVAPGRVVLRWHADGPFERFVVERSHDGGDTIAVAELAANPTRAYEVVDSFAPRTGEATYWIVAHSALGVDRAGPYRVAFGAPGPALSVRAFPSPTRESTSFRIVVPGSGTPRVRLSVLDVRGRVVRDLVDASMGAGTHVVRWDGRLAGASGGEGAARAPAGVYWYRLTAGEVSRNGSFIRR